MLEQPTANYGNPQIEDGHTRIANELLEAITLFDFSKRQYKILLFIIRKTYGFNKKSDQMSLSQIINGTGLDKSSVIKTLAELVELKIIAKQQVNYSNSISLNKLYMEWGGDKTSRDKLSRDKTSIRGVIKHPSGGDKTSHTKDTITKDNNKRKLPKDFCISESVIKWANENGFDNLEKHFNNFILSCEAKNYKYVNWDSAFKRAISDNWAKIPVKAKRTLVI